MIELPVPENLGSFTEDMEQIAQRDSHIFWKVKAAASRYVYRLFSKYGRPL